jgi:ABC-type polar amino acid transport system ATPase subunit
MVSVCYNSSNRACRPSYALKNFKGNVLLTTHDHAFAQTVGNRIIELTPNGIIDRYLTFDEYMTDPKIKELRNKLYV